MADETYKSARCRIGGMRVGDAPSITLIAEEGSNVGHDNEPAPLTMAR
jgi:hypothetical protein